MTNCECPLAGYCKRHKVSKPSGWHSLCQTRESYYAAWEAGRGPGQAGRNPRQEIRSLKRQPDGNKEQRRKRVLEATQRKERLVSWLKLFRTEAEKGIGDTADRVVKQQKKSKAWIASDAHDAVNCLLKQCSCSRIDAVERLNTKYPY